MIDGSLILFAALAYVVLLFAIAWYGDRLTQSKTPLAGHPAIYSLSLAVYCTSWTFFGSVGLAATTGLDFIPVYLGPLVFFILCSPLIRRIARLAKTQNITSIADFIAARYGKSSTLAALVTIIAVIGTLPYIALQLKAVSNSLVTLIDPASLTSREANTSPVFGDIAFVVAMMMAAFTVLFGTRHIDATEHQQGLMLAIATESIVKLFAFLLVGTFVTFGMFGGLSDLLEAYQANQQIASPFSRGLNGGTWITVTFLSFVCIMLLPRQFHVTIVENNSERQIKYATWLFPIYLILINLFVIPIALAGILNFPDGTVDADTFVLALPMSVNANTVTVIAFLGGLSAATAMVIVASVALSIMVSNDLLLPAFLRQRLNRASTDDELIELGPMILIIRRIAIFAILFLGYLFYRMVGDSYALASIGLLSFSAIAQFAPAFFGGLVWKQATARGAIAGISAGFLVWSYTLLLPWFVKSSWLPSAILTDGPFGIAFLRPQALFGIDLASLPHGVFWSMLVNVVLYIAVSLYRAPEPIERLQASVFIKEDLPVTPTPAFRLWRTSITAQDLQRTAARYLGAERAQRSFKEYADSHGLDLTPETEADIELFRFTEFLLASAIGAASSRLVLSLLLRKSNVSHQSALKLLDDASEALQYNRDLLQSALDQVGQGISVLDSDMRLICWNRRFRELMDLPPELGRVGVPVDTIIRHLSERGVIGNGNIEETVVDRVNKLVTANETFQEKFNTDGRILEIRTNKMPQGGIVTTFTDITQRVRAAEDLKRANETLERRVKERTAELTKVNRALSEAKSKADAANLDKTRFLAAASHDILQPLNAARLFTASLVERTQESNNEQLVQNVDASLSAVEDIMSALLDISRLDAGAMKADITVFQLDEIIEQLHTEFEPLAKEKGLDLRVVPTSVWIRSDKRLLRRVLQNLLSNAIKYTQKGRILIGGRRRDNNFVFQVHDTGPGISRSDQPRIFREFKRLDDTSQYKGLGLGLSIVQRISNVLNHPIGLRSRVGVGSVFSVTLETAPTEERHSATVTRIKIPGDMNGMNVFCIDNEPRILDGMRTLLTGWGCNLQLATGLDDISAKTKEEMPQLDIILADYHLDEGTGLDAIKMLHDLYETPVPAIIITADRTIEVQKLIRERGIFLLRKPVKPASLRATINQALRQLVAAE